MTQEELIIRARRVRALLNSEDVQAVFAELEADMLRDIRLTAWDEAAMRERIHAELRALDRITSRLRAWSDELDK
jgi:vacuolar-type H+-ATPase subunit C/Vma6